MGILWREFYSELVEQAAVSDGHHPGPKTALAAVAAANWRPVGAGGGFVCAAGLGRAFDFLLAHSLRVCQHLRLSAGGRRARLVAIPLQSEHKARPSRVKLQKIHSQRSSVLESRRKERRTDCITPLLTSSDDRKELSQRRLITYTPVCLPYSSTISHTVPLHLSRLQGKFLEYSLSDSLRVLL